MNRRKKINQILKKRAKQANAKVNTKKKTKYISKAERAIIEENDQAQIQASEADDTNAI